MSTETARESMKETPSMGTRQIQGGQVHSQHPAPQWVGTEDLRTVTAQVTWHSFLHQRMKPGIGSDSP